MNRAPIILSRFGAQWMEERDDVDLTALFARLPDEIVLDIAARDFEPGDPERCLCGWALRESLARVAGIDPDDAKIPRLNEFGLTSEAVVTPLVNLFGGSYAEWSAVYWGVNSSMHTPLIEAAWTERVMQAAGVLS